MRRGVHVWRLLRSRVINVRSMDARLRLVTAVAGVALLAATVLTAGRRLPLPVAATLDSGGRPAQIAAPVLLLTLAMLGGGLGWLFAGALHSWWPVRIAATAGAVGLLIPAPAPTPVVRSAEMAMAGVCVALAAVTILVDRPRGRPRALEPIRTAVATVLLPLLYVVLSTQGSPGGRQVLGAVLTWQMGRLGWVLIPVLILAGVDFADWAEIGSGRVGDLIERVPGPALPLVAMAVCVAVALPTVLAAGAQPLMAIEFLLFLPLAIPLLALAVAVGRWRRLPRRVPYVALAGFAVLYLAVSYTTSEAWRPKSQYAWNHRLLAGQVAATYSETEPVPMSLDYPVNWVVKESGTPDWASVNLRDTGTNEQFDVLVSILPTYNAHIDIRADLRRFCSDCTQVLTKLEGQPRWEVTKFVLHRKDGATLTGVAFAGFEQNHSIMAAGFAPSKLFDHDLPIFRAMAATLTPQATAPGAPASVQAVYYASYDAADAARGVVYLLAAGLLAVIVLLLRHRTHRTVVAAALFAIACSAFYSLETLRPIGAEVLHIPKRAIPFMGKDGLQVAVAAASLLALGWILLRHRSSRRGRAVALQILVLNAGLQLLSWIYTVYYKAADAGGRISLVQAVFILFALAWDVLLSGETITNPDGRRFPRPGRVLMFFGYMLVVAAAVMFGSALSSDIGTPLSPQFDSDGWAMYGLLFLGAPILLTHTAIGLAGITAGDRDEPEEQLEAA